ncbi:MAG: 1-deoxy-D-xylulose-5-phosphate reductoisomerase [Bacteroidales bacterium]|nr:1-deoxy-D-xylulose-5-phosphate reductoisomerase [Bacteroidales bacterium]MBR4714867.1 1-deoxy-D-xylulose-5-phosphate reductoisomerase [Bacteroidales bacterium]
MNKKRIAILGSTGSIGTQTLNVIRRHPDLFEAEVLVAGSNAELLIKQALEFQPNMVVIADKSKYGTVCDALSSTDIKVFAGEESVCDIVEMDCVDIVMAAIVGFAGLKPTLNAIWAKKTIALANKETMVVAGEIVTAEARKNGVAILPVDSEHSAIFQTLQGEFHNKIDKILLTASGGPLFGRKREQIENVTLAEVLKHPNWSMGRKVTIDSASLMNKGLEVIEAKWLFGVGVDKIEVLVHPQSIVHSMVQFEDGSIKAQIGTPTMETPIQYALSYPHRIESHIPRFSFWEHPELTFFRPDTETFRCLPLAYNAIEQGGNIPCVMNAANEVAVQRFIDGKLRFIDIAGFVEQAISKATYIAHPTLDQLLECDTETRKTCNNI